MMLNTFEANADFRCSYCNDLDKHNNTTVDKLEHPRIGTEAHAFLTAYFLKESLLTWTS